MIAAAPYKPDTLVTTYVEMTTPAAFRPAYSSDQGIEIVRMETPDVGFYRFLYRSVGEQWAWRDRMLLSDRELQHILSSPTTSVYVLYADGVPAGYFELARQGRSTEIAYFGLRSAFMGRGLGKHLLSYAIAQAWSEGTRRVWLHTCNLDSPHALDNYLKRGFSVYDVQQEPMPERYL